MKRREFIKMAAGAPFVANGVAQEALAKTTFEQFLRESAVSREVIDRFLHGPSWAQFDPELNPSRLLSREAIWRGGMDSRLYVNKCDLRSLNSLDAGVNRRPLVSETIVTLRCEVGDHMPLSARLSFFWRHMLRVR